MRMVVSNSNHLHGITNGRRTRGARERALLCLQSAQESIELKGCLPEIRFAVSYVSVF